MTIVYVAVPTAAMGRRQPRCQLAAKGGGRSGVPTLLSNEVSVSMFEHVAASLEDAKARTPKTNADKVFASAAGSREDAEQIPREQQRYDDAGHAADFDQNLPSLRAPLFGEPQIGDVGPEDLLQVQVGACRQDQLVLSGDRIDRRHEPVT